MLSTISKKMLVIPKTNVSSTEKNIGTTEIFFCFNDFTTLKNIGVFGSSVVKQETENKLIGSTVICFGTE